VKQPFSAWRQGAPYYAPVVVCGLVFLNFGDGGWVSWAGGLVILFGLYILFFFRDPVRAITAAENEVVSPADGTIVGIDPLEDSPHYDGPCIRVSIFLSVFNVHVNRAPFSGSVRSIDYKPGQFLNAMNPASSERNESNTVRLDTQHGLMTVRQISGLIARRIVCAASAGDTLAKGQKFGMIKFGSRTELYLAPTAEIVVAMREKVRAGATCIARMR